jgi:membrane protease YdiL (CAAX protease family)
MAPEEALVSPPEVRWPFEPRRPPALIFTILASVVCVPVLFGGSIWSALSPAPWHLEDPVRALAIVSEVDRRLAAAFADAPAPARYLLLGLTEDLREQTESDWNQLIDDLETDEIWEGYTSDARLARDVVMANWGDTGARARVVATDTLDRVLLPPELKGPAEDVAAERALTAGEISPASLALSVAFVTGELVLLIAGVLLLAIWLARRRPSLMLAERPVAGTFGLGRGYTVLAWCMVITIVFMIALGALSVDDGSLVTSVVDVLFSAGTLVVGVPLVLLAWWTLLQPQGIALPALFATRATGSGLAYLGLIVIAVAAIERLFGIGVELGADTAGYAMPWYFIVNETLMFGRPTLAALSVLDAVVGAAVVEELLFRGVLYTGLRRHLRALPAALISGVVFGAIHGYDPVGFVAVSFSGVLYALVYERTNSLVPCMLVHGLSNLMMVGFTFVYRFAL